MPGPTLNDVKRRLLAAQKLVLQSGLTGVHDAGISDRVAQAYRELDREGRLRRSDLRHGLAAGWRRGLVCEPGAAKALAWLPV